MGPIGRGSRRSVPGFIPASSRSYGPLVYSQQEYCGLMLKLGRGPPEARSHRIALSRPTPSVFRTRRRWSWRSCQTARSKSPRTARPRKRCSRATMFSRCGWSMVESVWPGRHSIRTLAIHRSRPMIRGGRQDRAPPAPASPSTQAPGPLAHASARPDADRHLRRRTRAALGWSH